MKFNGTKNQFLANQIKIKTISLIGKELKEATYEFLYASDADVDIVDCSKRRAI